MKPYFNYGTSASDRDLITSTTNYAGKLKRYFSSLDAEIFFGDKRIEDIVKIDFSYEEKRMPIYGFNSFIPSRIFVGQKLIQGTFVINFTEVGYIANLLKTIPPSNTWSELERIGKSCDAMNAPLFPNAFDILIGYGGHNIPEELSYNATAQTLEGVVINRYDQILDTSGEPVLEVYGFLAKNLVFSDSIKKPAITPDDSPKGKGAIKESSLQGHSIVEQRIESDVQSLRSMCSFNDDLLGIVVDIKHCLNKDNTSYIKLSFTEIFNQVKGDDIDNIKLTIYDNQIDLSNTYKLSYFNKDWIIRLSESETLAIKKKLSVNELKSIQCLLEMDIKRYNKTDNETINKNIGINRGDNY